MANFLNKFFSSFKKKEESNKSNPTEHTLEQLNQEKKSLESYTRGLEFYEENNFDEALKSFDEAILNEIVKDTAIYQYRGNCFQQLDRHPNAIKDFTNSITQEPNDWEVYYYRANSYEEMHDSKNQYSDIRRVKEILESKRNLLKYEEDRLRSCIDELRRLETEIGFQDEKKAIEEQYENLIQELRKNNKKYSEKEPIPRKIYISTYEQSIRKGLAFDKEDKKDIALEYYDYAIGKNVTDDKAFCLRAFCLQNLGFYLDAIDDFTKAIALAPDDCNLYFGRGSSYFSIKDFKLAIENGKEAVKFAKMNEPFFEAYNEQAKTLGFESALDLYEFHLNIWEAENNSNFDNTMESLHKKMLQSEDESAFTYVENYQNNQQAKNRELYKRRPNKRT